MRTGRVNILLYCFLAIAGTIRAEEHRVKVTVKDYSGTAVPDAQIEIRSPEGECFYGLTDSLGRAAIPVLLETAVPVPETASGNGDELKGIRYTLNSSRGNAVVFNVLGRKVAEIELMSGTHELGVIGQFAAGRYFIYMETPVYRAVSSVMLIDGQVSGIGRTEVRYRVDQHIGGMKKNLSFYEMRCYRQGYEEWVKDFDILADFQGFEDTILLNRMPVMAADMPDTLWNGVFLDHFIDNDDRGLWNTVSGVAGILESSVQIEGARIPSYTDFHFAYHDSVNTELEIAFEKMLYHGRMENTALAVVCENLGMSGDSQLELAFLLFHDAVINILAETFHIDPSGLEGLTLAEMIDTYGEEWQMEEMVRVALPFYGRIVLLSDSLASRDVVIDSLVGLAGEGYTIDLIFSLHGESDCVTFVDGCHDISLFLNDLNKNDVQIRMLYQTCCSGSGMIDDWEAYGSKAVNGAVDLNSLVIFSPVYFLQYWTTGLSYMEAVQKALESELNTLLGFKTVFPFIELLLGTDVMEKSAQATGGSRPAMYWIQD